MEKSFLKLSPKPHNVDKKLSWLPGAITSIIAFQLLALTTYAAGEKNFNIKRARFNSEQERALGLENENCTNLKISKAKVDAAIFKVPISYDAQGKVTVSVERISLVDESNLIAGQMRDVCPDTGSRQ